MGASHKQEIPKLKENYAISYLIPQNLVKGLINVM